MAVNDKPTHASGYKRELTDLVRRGCLEVATRLQDFMDEICVVGGLVPSLLIDQNDPPHSLEVHVGTHDLDLGLSIAVLSEQRYEEIAQRLRSAGFDRDKNEAGNFTSQRWRSKEGMLVDFLIEGDNGGALRNLKEDFAAIQTPGLPLAFRDRETVLLHGRTLTGGTTERPITVCGPGAYVVLKALAFQSRGENKDAYDLYYVVRGREDTRDRLHQLYDSAHTRRAVKTLENDFSQLDRIGPRRVADFIHGTSDDELQADVAGLIRELIAGIGQA